MKTLYHVIFCTVFFSINKHYAQCGSAVNGGSSGNMFTQIRNSTNPVAVDKNLNTVVFIHRNNATSFFGNSGQLRYDISTNAGATWTLDLGVLNPLASSAARYPNVAIFNPSNNINPNNAYIGYMAPTIHLLSSAWNGCVSGVIQMNGSGNTENYNQPIVNPQLIQHSVVKGAPGIFWAADALFNGVNITGFAIYKGTWNGSTDINWAHNFSVTPSFNTGLSATPTVGDYNIAFDPTGTFGWFSFLGHVSPGPSNYAYYPVFYKTTNGGQSWTGPITVDLNQLSCLTSSMTSPNVVTTNFEHDLTVDLNGNPHLFTTICNGNNAYSVFYGSWHHVYDITQKNGIWLAYDVSNVNAGRGTWGTSPNQASMDMSPQVARSADGSKVFFTWADNGNYTLGQANLSPNLFSRAYNVSTNQWTPIKNFSSCNVNTDGKILFPHVAAEVLEPGSGQFKLAPIYGEYSVPNDPLQITNFKFLDNCLYTSTEFSIAGATSQTFTTSPSTLLLCPNSTVNVGMSGSGFGQWIWSTGATTSVLPVSNGTVTTYSVIAQQNCNIGTATVTVSNLSVAVSSPTTAFCYGTTFTLNANGNANAYTWYPGAINGASAVIVATSTPVYTLSSLGSGGCIYNQTMSINALPLPTVTIAGNNTVCAGTPLTLSASGASTYIWSNGSVGSSCTFSPSTPFVCTVAATDANGCGGTATLSIQVFQNPIISLIIDKSVVCAGTQINLTASGALTYSWTLAGAAGQSCTDTPMTSVVYTVTGYDSELCSSTQTVGVLVNPLPIIVISTTRTLVCKGEKAVLTASGATSYTWNTGLKTSTIQITPNATSIYTAFGTSTAGCINSSTFTQQFSDCLSLNETNINSEIQVYPNPNHGKFEVKLTQRMQLQLYDQLGQLVRKDHPDAETNYTTSYSGLSSGLYFIQASFENHRLTKKIIVSD